MHIIHIFELASPSQQTYLVTLRLTVPARAYRTELTQLACLLRVHSRTSLAQVVLVMRFFDSS